jgi:hypothetical protein
MTTAKVDIKIGQLSFAGEGDKEWLAKQLDKLIQHAPTLLRLSPDIESHSEVRTASRDGDHKTAPAGKAGTLAAFLTARGAKTKDNRKFLATAAWLHDKGHSRLTAADVTKALDENSQGKVTNPALVLSRHISKGHCERSGSQFYVTDEGRKSLG